MVSKQPTIPVLVESALVERQGFEIYADMLDHWAPLQIASHFAEHYKVERLDAHESIILDAILDMLRPGELETMIRQHKVTDVIECAKMSGYVTELHDHYVISIEYPNQITSRH